MPHRDENPTESLDQEGMPGELFDQPPGVDVETEEEGLVAPREHSIASGSDPAYPNTVREERFPESVAERAAREQPEFGAGDGDAAARAPRLLEPDLDEEGEDSEDEEIGEVADEEGDDEGPEESAMHLTSEDVADDLDPLAEREQYLEGR